MHLHICIANGNEIAFQGFASLCCRPHIHMSLLLVDFVLYRAS